MIGTDAPSELTVPGAETSLHNVAACKDTGQPEATAAPSIDGHEGEARLTFMRFKPMARPRDMM